MTQHRQARPSGDGWDRGGAAIAIYANNGGGEFPVSIGKTFSVNLRYQFLPRCTLDPGLLAAAAEDVTTAVAAGALRVGEKAGLPLHRYALEATPAAHDAVEQGAVGAKWP